MASGTYAFYAQSRLPRGNRRVRNYAGIRSTTYVQRSVFDLGGKTVVGPRTWIPFPWAIGMSQTNTCRGTMNSKDEKEQSTLSSDFFLSISNYCNLGKRNSNILREFFTSSTWYNLCLPNGNIKQEESGCFPSCIRELGKISCCSIQDNVDHDML